VSVRDDRTVVFTLQRAFSDFPFLVSAGNYNAVVLKANYPGHFTRNPIGTGPFLLESYSATAGATYRRNPTYWQRGKPYLDGVKVSFYADSQAQQLALQGGTVDVLALTDVSTVQAGGDIVIDKVAGTGITTFTLRVDKSPFDSKEVRQAVAYALDRPAVNEVVDDKIGLLGNDHLYAPVYPAAPTDIAQRAKDAAKVHSLLATAGVSKLEFTLTYDPPNKDYALVIQDQLKQVGITVHLDQQSSQAFYGGDQTKDTPWLFSTANLVGWAGRAVPSEFVAPMVTSKGVWNGSKYANPHLDAALLAYDAATTLAGRKKQAEVIAQALHEDVPVIISIWNGAARAYNKTTFAGIKAHPSSYVDFTDVSRI
jgi:peptide/nickel transport system substrate-binding protein